MTTGSSCRLRNLDALRQPRFSQLQLVLHLDLRDVRTGLMISDEKVQQVIQPR